MEFFKIIKLLTLILVIAFISGCSTLTQQQIEPFGYKFDRFIVKEGQTIEYLSDQFGIPANIILILNNRPQDSEVEEGDELIVPFYNEVYPVRVSVEDWADQCEDLKESPPRLIWPVTGAKVSSKFGRRWGSFHKGLDLRAPIGIPIFAAHSGRVIKADNEMSGFGNLTVIQGRGLRTYYAHQSRFFVRQGDGVRQGDLIGYVGNTGRVTGAHLHFETRAFDGEQYRVVDPGCFFVG